MTETHVAALLDGLAISSDMWVAGGWGVDALLGGQSREHRDLDLIVSATQCALVRELLGRLGYRQHPHLSPAPPFNITLLDDALRAVDIRVAYFVDDDAYLQTHESAWSLYGVEELGGVGTIAHRKVRCLTAQGQIRAHLGYDPAPVDVADVRAVSEHAGLEIPPAYRRT